MQPTTTLIVGASVSGLACAASLQRKGIDYIIIEKEPQTAMPWRRHYERLHLHTNKTLSNLPYKKFSAAIPRYPSRRQVVDYLEQYQKEFGIHPVFNTEAVSVRKEDGKWTTETNNGIFISACVIVATGAFGKPKPVYFKGMETFPGEIVHSCSYKTGRHFKGKKVLVVGFGNSACEIAIDLYEHGAIPSMAVRSAVNVVPRDIMGIPILQLSLAMKFLPPKLADSINAPLLRWLTGDITKLGLKKLPYGPLQQIQKYRTAPVLDIGTVKLIREEHVAVYNGIDFIDYETVHFTGGKKDQFDAIVAAIGYSGNYADIINVDKKRFDDLKVSVNKQKYFGEEGLYFCGFWIAPTGQFREIGLDAQKIANHIARRFTSTA
jgi:hypothetical protein